MKLLLSISFFLTMTYCEAQKTQISGSVYNKEGLGFSDVTVYIFPKNDSAKSNSSGFFSFNDITDSLIEIKVSRAGFRTYSIKVKNDGHDIKMLDLYLYPLCKYDSSNGICPKCHNRKRVIPIVYGLPVGELNQDYFYAGCEVSSCDPKYYCRKHKLKL